ncbi:transposable element Tcb2 transposase [Trichonephila clavipes]|nr:transposable element Tcb2 transposase [Trichonephila clavipes]
MANNQSVRRHLDAFTRGRIIGKLEEGRSVTSVAAEFGIAHSIVSRLWRQFQTTGTAIQGFSSGRPRGTTPADDRYIVLQARRNRLHGGGLFARRPVRCVPLTPAHRRRRSLWCREHRNWRDNEWGRVLFTDESRFSLSSDSHRILIWRERGSRNHPSNIIERDRGAMGLQFLFMDDNAPCHRTVAVEQLLESEDIERMDWPARSPDLNPIEHVWDFLGRRLAARTLPPVMIWELRLALQDEWAAMPQQLIDTLILSMGRRCEICLAELSARYIREFSGVNKKRSVERRREKGRRKKKNHKEEKRGDFGAKETNSNSEPSFLVVEKSLSNVTKSSGETVRMKCEVKGRPVPKIRWYKNEAPLEPERGKVDVRKYNSGHGKIGSRLRILHVDIHDTGYYKCEATNDKHSVETTGILIVKADSCKLLQKNVAKTTWTGIVASVERSFLCCPLCYSTPPDSAKAYHFLHHSINRQVANKVAKADANSALSPSFRYVSTESSL